MRQIVNDVVGHDFVAGNKFGKFHGLEKGVEPEPDEEQQADDEEVGAGIEGNGFDGFFQGAGGHEALDGDLVGAVVLHELEEKGEGNNGAGHDKEIQFPVGNMQATGFSGECQNRFGSAVDAINQTDGNPDGSADQDDKLDGIGPYDGCESAEGGVGGCKESHHEDAAPERNAGDDGHGHGGRIDDGSKPAEAGQYEESGDTVAGWSAESFLDVFVGCGDLQAMIERVEEHQDERRYDGTHDADDDERNIFGVGGAGQAEVGDGAGERGVHAHGYNEPRQLASAEKKHFGAFLLSGKVEANAQHAGKVGCQDQVVECPKLSGVHRL